MEQPILGKPLSFAKTPVQQQALKLLSGPAANVLLYGGSRSGKTFILIYGLLVRALKAPGSRHIVLRHRANAVRQSVRQDTFAKVLKLAFPELAYTESRSDQFVRLANRSEIWFAGLDSDERVEKILGKEFATIYFNECSEISYAAVNIALTRLAQKTTLVNRAWFDCNPAGKSHWSYKLFLQKTDPETNLPLAFPDHYDSMILNPADNAANLPASYLAETLNGLTERQKQRFMHGIWLEENTNALWKYALIDPLRVARPPVELIRTVVGIDPAVTSQTDSDATGIVTVALGRDRHFYVLSDASCRAKPLQWAQTAIDEYRKFRADRIVAEVNNGGELVEAVLRNLDPFVSYKALHAAKGKFSRAEPVAALYEQQRVHHVGSFPQLEEQMTSYNPVSFDGSPDRLDALVWAITELCGHSPEHRFIVA